MYARTGLGFAPLAATTIAPAFGPAAPIAAGVLAAASLAAAIFPRIGAGRTEADAIVPVQNAVGDRLGEINAAIDRTSVPGLQALAGEVIELGRYFRGYVADPRFTDGRASEQALNTIMPLIDGTGDYSWPELQGRTVAVDIWGNPVNGGTLGTIQRRILALGGPALMTQLTQYGGPPRLEAWQPGTAYTPQAGTLPPVSPPKTFSSYPTIDILGQAQGWLPWILAGAFLWGISKAGKL